MNELELIKLEKLYQSTTNIDEQFKLDRQYRAYLENKLLENPKDIQSLIYLGVLCWEPFHEQDKAMNYLEKAISLDPKNVDARFWLAKCLYHDYCAYEKAKHILLEALKLNPSRADCLSLLASIILDTTKQIDEAISYLSKAVQYAPDWPSLRFFLGSLYLEEGQIELSKKEAQAIQELAKNPLKTAKNFIEDYYEIVVTGRGDKKIQEDLKNFWKEIQNC